MSAQSYDIPKINYRPNLGIFTNIIDVTTGNVGR